MKKFKEKRMASYVLRSNELIQEGKTKEKNPGAKEMREWAETHVEKPELKEIKRIKKPNCK